MYIFCLDVGGTRTRGALFTNSGTELARAVAEGGALSLGVTRSYKAIEDVWAQVCGIANLPDIRRENTSLLAGIAGYGLPGLSDALSEKLGDFADVYICGDGYGSLLAATEGKPGALISVGTGVIAMRLNEDGKTLCLSGWGFPAGDLGSGAWLGLQLVGDLTKFCDGIAMDPPLTVSLAADVTAITGQATDQIMDWHCNGKPAQFGSLAPLIVEGAATGDLYCISMLKRSAVEIAAIAGALCPSGVGDVFLAGGLGSILKPYCAELAPGFNWRMSTGDPLLGLLTIAMSGAPREDQLPRPGFA